MTWKIPLTRIDITEEHKKVALEIVESTYLTEGRHVKEFEALVAEIIGTKHCIACANGTAALMLIFWILREKYNKVICPALTFPATLNAALLTGYDAILKDCSDNDPFLIDGTGLEKTTPNDLILPVHLLGYPCKMEKILEKQKSVGFGIVEDNCEAVGTSYGYKKTGSFGIAGAHSFYPTHQIAGGELGAITTDDDAFASKLRSIKNHGRVGSNLQFNHAYVGYNFKALEICAAFATIQLKQLDSIMKRRQAIVKKLNRKIKNKALILPEFRESVSYLCYPLGIRKGRRADFIEALTKAGIESRTMFPCLANQAAYSGYDLTNQGNFTFDNANIFEKNYFYITCNQSLTDKEIEYIAETLNKVKL